jgi:SAM-dependent methyltransferase
MATASNKQALHHVPINRTEIDQALLNIESKERSNPLPWNGQFSPQFVEALLDKYASEAHCVLDPFSGSGTLLFEASSRKLAALGSDINPAACYLARIYTLASRSSANRLKLCDRFEQILQECFPEEMPLFRDSGWRTTLKEKTTQLLPIREAVAQSDGTVLLAALIVLCDFYSDHTKRKDLLDGWKRLRRIVSSLSESTQPIKVFNADARRLPIRDSQVDLVITSPPYINVFNYHQQFRQTVEALGWHSLHVAKAEIGSNRKHRANRFLTVIQYCLDMVQVLAEVNRVCKPSSRVIFVVGRESRVRGIPFYNARLVGAVAELVGFELITRQERVFTNRFGQSIFEDILHFARSAGKKADPLAEARHIAIASLKQAIEGVAGEVRDDIAEAIKSASAVMPSPLYNGRDAFDVLHRFKGILP